MRELVAWERMQGIRSGGFVNGNAPYLYMGEQAMMRAQNKAGIFIGGLPCQLC